MKYIIARPRDRRPTSSTDSDKAQHGFRIREFRPRSARPRSGPPPRRGRRADLAGAAVGLCIGGLLRAGVVLGLYQRAEHFVAACAPSLRGCWSPSSCSRACSSCWAASSKASGSAWRWAPAGLTPAISGTHAARRPGSRASSGGHRLWDWSRVALASSTRLHEFSRTRVWSSPRPCSAWACSTCWQGARRHSCTAPTACWPMPVFLVYLVGLAHPGFPLGLYLKITWPLHAVLFAIFMGGDGDRPARLRPADRRVLLRREASRSGSS